MDSRAHVLGIPIDAVTRKEAVEKLCDMLKGQAQCHVMTPNAEMLVEASRNPGFAKILKSSALNLPDSQGLVWMAQLKGQYLPERVTGADTVEELCKTLHGGIRVFLLGAREGVAQKAADALREKNPDLNIVMTMSGSPRGEDVEKILIAINGISPHLLLVAFGAPAQDIWIDQNLKHMPSVRVAMGVGGTFDFLAGVQKRAPKILQNIGLEWMWRFVQEPSRWKRMWNAVVVFPTLVISGRNF